MARAGLGPDWQCLLANDFDPKKGAAYAANWGDDHLRVADVATLSTADLPGCADLAWASFPCQDLSLAGAGAGLKGERSGTFWPFRRPGGGQTARRDLTHSRRNQAAARHDEPSQPGEGRSGEESRRPHGRDDLQAHPRRWPKRREDATRRNPLR
ncbi:DNA cytosine methyltransferase [Escherichia coli]|uniref:DNA cytosine methyltransferase n=1 Tax=Escherichia coli TaxID=562 RepID=UPI0008FB27BF|nr:DNA cytosine methyltransferase [Salmonella enterica subsp. enterica serovar Livingstone]EEQ1736798.1 DNA cytosine methyltransferase [Escherichia coli]EFA6547010.1 DNA cytosine methyltransferase [Escherichia coli O157:H7]EHE8152585.1 DNA cytosine methyltransferase [Salmonella enterica subsp. enterica serovar Agona]EEU9306023.1 DNA cytosine methyltransferase [Escherichia coli]